MPTSDKNKVKYGLDQVHIYPITKQDGETTTYGEAFTIPGAVNLSISPEGEENKFYADNVVYWSDYSNNGYSGNLEIAILTDEFREKILGETVNDDGVHIESSDDKNTQFAMAFQFLGDKNNIRHVLYRCSAARPDVEGETKGESIDPKTDTLEFTAMPRINDHQIKARTEQGSKAYEAWFDKPYAPAESEGEEVPAV